MQAPEKCDPQQHLMNLLGELSKYVSASPRRFSAAQCDSSGNLKLRVDGAVGESPLITVIDPSGRVQSERAVLRASADGGRAHGVLVFSPTHAGI